MNKYSVADIVAALRYYEEWRDAIQNGDNDQSDLDEVLKAIDKWYAALKAITDALPEPDSFIAYGQSGYR